MCSFVWQYGHKFDNPIFPHCETPSMPLGICLQFPQILTNFQNSSTVGCRSKFATKPIGYYCI